MNRLRMGFVLITVLFLGACIGAPSRTVTSSPEPAPPPPVAGEESVVAEPTPPASVPSSPPRESPRQQPAMPAAPSAGEVVCPPGETRSAWDLFLEGINSLQVGDEVEARHWLELALCQDPQHRRSLRVLDQIDSPLSSLFKQQATEYRVQAGDTLSKIAKQAYDDPFLFYALARFNGIENPSRVAVGQVLRVPELQTGGTAKLESQEAPAPSPPPDEDRTPPAVSSDPPGGRYQDQVVVTLEADDDRDPSPRIRYTLDGSDPSRGGESYTAPLRIDKASTLRFLAEDRAGNPSPMRSERYEIVSQAKHRDVEDLRDRGDHAAALERLERILEEDPGDREAQSLFVDIATIRADVLQAQGDLLGAQGLLQRVNQLQPDDQQVQERLEGLERQIGIDQMLQNATDAMQQGDYETAYTALNQVLELEPTHAVARGKRVVVRSELVDQYGKRAVSAFRRQDLDESIRQWDKVLELEPDNEEARLRRQEAVHLKETFEKKFN